MVQRIGKSACAFGVALTFTLTVVVVLFSSSGATVFLFATPAPGVARRALLYP